MGSDACLGAAAVGAGRAAWRRARAPWRQGAPQVWNKDLPRGSSEPGSAGWRNPGEVREPRRAGRPPSLRTGQSQARDNPGGWTSPARKLQLLRQLYDFSPRLRGARPPARVDFRGIYSSLGGWIPVRALLLVSVNLDQGGFLSVLEVPLGRAES